MTSMQYRIRCAIQGGAWRGERIVTVKIGHIYHKVTTPVHNCYTLNFLKLSSVEPTRGVAIPGYVIGLVTKFDISCSIRTYVVSIPLIRGREDFYVDEDSFNTINDGVIT